MISFAIIFPVLLLAGIIWFFVRWLRAELSGGNEGLLLEPGYGRRLHPDRIHFRMDSGDILPVIVITAIMAFVSFLGLGSHEAPESFFRFTDSSSYTIDLKRGRTVTGFEYYTGLWEGKYTVELSSDGYSWFAPYKTEQSYAELFRWIVSEPAEENGSLVFENCRYVKISAENCPIELGEIAILGEDGKPLDPAGFKYPDSISALFDEQDIVPAEPDYLNGTYFDEIYHARTAYEHFKGVKPYEISHPPLGKLIIMVGIWLFGMNPFGWRVMGTLFGVVLIPVFYALLKRMFGRRSVAVFGTLLISFEFMRFTQSRIATLDTFAELFILLMYLFMYRWYTSDYESPFRKTASSLALSGLFFGLGAATKWTAVYAGAGLFIIFVLTLALRFRYLRRTDRKHEFWPFLIKSLLLAFLMFIVVPAAIYCLTYIAYAVNGEKFTLSIVLENQKYMFNYHSGVSQDHPYASRWYMWIADARPILYYLNYISDNIRSSFAAFNNPLLSWSGLIAQISLCALFPRIRDKRILFLTVGYLAQIVPWIFISRTTFAYHYYPSMLFLILAICYVADRLESLNVPYHRAAMWGFGAVAGMLFCLFYPVLSGVPVSELYANIFLRWFPSWPF
ncbi:MAG: phospholipid carrier-dependent glycosyltransferase [Oscillospiraceae bacterium]|jgi:dolichyl-phosphate-mannose-protein mannosyltransferase